MSNYGSIDLTSSTSSTSLASNAITSNLLNTNTQMDSVSVNINAIKPKKSKKQLPINKYNYNIETEEQFRTRLTKEYVRPAFQKELESALDNRYFYSKTSTIFFFLSMFMSVISSLLSGINIELQQPMLSVSVVLTSSITIMLKSIAMFSQNKDHSNSLKITTLLNNVNIQNILPVDDDSDDDNEDKKII